MLAVLAYLRAFPEGGSERRGWLIVTLCLFAAALLSKAVAVSLPAVLLILDVYPLRRLRAAHGYRPGSWAWRVGLEKVPFAALSAVFMVLAYAGRAEARRLAPADGWGFPSRFAQACYGVWFYPIKTVLPWPITAYYPMPERVDLGELAFLLSVLGTLGVSLGVLLLSKKRPALACAWFSYLVVLAPTSGLVQIGSQVAADRYAYMAMMGLLVPFADGVCRLLRPARFTGLACSALAAALILGLAVRTRDQCRIWRTSERLWSHVLTHGAGRDFMALKIMGAILLVQGRDEEALARLTESLRLRPDYADTRYNMGLALSRLGRFEEAAEQYAEAVRLDPDHADAHANLGVMLSRQGRFDEAERRFATALRLDPGHVNAHYNLGLIFSERGRIERARSQFAAALRADPGHVNALANLGVVLARQGRLREAATQLAEALRLDPGHVEARANLGVVLSRMGRTDEAIAEYAESLRLKSGNPNVHQ
jgi:tetratricopeptide (TPR) repeat protein